MTGDNNVIAELKIRRQSMALMLSELAARSGIEEDLLRAWENGHEYPTLDALLQWAAAIGLRLSLAPAAENAKRQIRIDWDKRRITVDGTAVRLTPMEWRVIERLARTPGALVTHQELYRYVYDQDWNARGQATAVRVLVTKLRRLLPLQIEARWGQGYILTGIEPPQPQHSGGMPQAGKGADQATAPQRAAGNGALVTQPPTTQPGLSGRPALLRSADVVLRHSAATVAKPQTCRTEELGVIERFLAERGATRCPDVRTIEKSPLPALTWDKVKRKWVRPVGEQLSTGGAL
jgi:transcriptional regulator with XRE-family HTH domain